MGKTFKWNMFFTSFLPLWVSITIFDTWSIVSYSLDYVSSYPLWYCNVVEFIAGILLEAITVITLVICSFSSIYGISREIKSQTKKPAKAKGRIIRAKRADKHTTGFLLAYILPVIAFDYGELKQMTLFLVYFAVLSFLCIRNDNIYTNILLEIKGYQMYNCDIEYGVMGDEQTYTDCLGISKNDQTQALPHDVMCFDFDNYIYIDIGGKSNE